MCSYTDFEIFVTVSVMRDVYRMPAVLKIVVVISYVDVLPGQRIIFGFFNLDSDHILDDFNLS